MAPPTSKGCDPQHYPAASSPLVGILTGAWTCTPWAPARYGASWSASQELQYVMRLSILMLWLQMAILAYWIISSLHSWKLPGCVGSSHTSFPGVSQPSSKSLIFAFSLLMSWFLHRSFFASRAPAPLIREMRAIMASTLPPFAVDTGLVVLVHIAIGHRLGLSPGIALKGGFPGEPNPTSRSESLYDLRH